MVGVFVFSSFRGGGSVLPLALVSMIAIHFYHMFTLSIK